MSYNLYMIGSHHSSLTMKVVDKVIGISHIIAIPNEIYMPFLYGEHHFSRDIFHIYSGSRIGAFAYHVICRSTIMSPLISLAVSAGPDKTILHVSLSDLPPPIQFGSRHSYSTRTNRYSANIPRFSTTFGQKIFGT